MLEPSLSLEADPALSRFPVHCHLVVPQKREKVPEQRKLHGLELTFQRLTKQRLGFWNAVQVYVGESQIQVAHWKVRFDFHDLQTFLHRLIVMAGSRRREG